MPTWGPYGTSPEHRRRYITPATVKCSLERIAKSEGEAIRRGDSLVGYEDTEFIGETTKAISLEQQPR